MQPILLQVNPALASCQCQPCSQECRPSHSRDFSSAQCVWKEHLDGYRMVYPTRSVPFTLAGAQQAQVSNIWRFSPGCPVLLLRRACTFLVVTSGCQIADHINKRNMTRHW
ncbi:hypothetical protein BDV12DRAFT_71794 [Aspergillus spectabilis]